MNVVHWLIFVKKLCKPQDNIVGFLKEINHNAAV